MDHFGKPCAGCVISGIQSRRRKTLDLNQLSFA